MHVITRKKLPEADRRYSGLGVPLDAWYRTAKSAKWKSLEEVRRTYSRADQTIRHVLTHAEYDKGDWKK